MKEKDKNQVLTFRSEKAENVENTQVLSNVSNENIEKAIEILKKYKEGKTNLENRIIDNEQWFKMRHWEQIRNSTGTEYASAWLFNSIANKHADAMDNYPRVNCLPREASDKKSAELLSEVLSVVLERNNFEKIYSDTWWYKLKAGTGVYGVFWNSKKLNGLGDVEIKQIDLLNVFWEPGIKNIQNSKNFFSIELTDNDTLISLYPQLKGKLGGESLEIAKYIYDDSVDTTQKSAVIDWYYKKRVNNRTVLHYCKFCNNEILYASENDSLYYEKGFYEHGEYPFVFDTLFVEEGTPCGFGYIDIMKDSQKQIDILNNAVMKSAVMGSNKRYFINSSGAVNESEFSDWSNNFVHVNGSNLGEDSIREIKSNTIPEIYLGILNSKIDELKETSGNRDFSQGGVTSGVTAASAIAALQEAGSKLTRDMVKGGFRAFSEINRLVIELIREFYDEPRLFRIVLPNGNEDFVSFDNRMLKSETESNVFGVTLNGRMPVFDIKVSAEKSSPFSRISQNELALQLYNSGLFNPEYKEQAIMALNMMDFEGKTEILNRLSTVLYEKIPPKNSEVTL